MLCIVVGTTFAQRLLWITRHRTGDTGVLDGDPPYWRILGRTSVDIIKSGGYKISTPAIEDVLLAHTRIREAAVLGLPDQALGEAVAAVVACEGGEVSRHYSRCLHGPHCHGR